MRRKGFVNEFVNVHVQGEAVYVSCDGGRVCRPLIICDKGVPRVKQEHITKLKTREAEGKCSSVKGRWGPPPDLRCGRKCVRRAKESSRAACIRWWRWGPPPDLQCGRKCASGGQGSRAV